MKANDATVRADESTNISSDLCANLRGAVEFFLQSRINTDATSDFNPAEFWGFSLITNEVSLLIMFPFHSSQAHHLWSLVSKPS